MEPPHNLTYIIINLMNTLFILLIGEWDLTLTYTIILISLDTILKVVLVIKKREFKALLLPVGLIKKLSKYLFYLILFNVVDNIFYLPNHSGRQVAIFGICFLELTSIHLTSIELNNKGMARLVKNVIVYLKKKVPISKEFLEGMEGGEGNDEKRDL